MKKTKKLKFDITTLLFILPAFILYTSFVIVPAVSSIYYSFTSWDGISTKLNFIGLANYIEIFKSERFFNAMKNTFLIAILVSVGFNLVALCLALLVDNVKKLKGIFRSAFYIPVLISGVVGGFIWTIMYNYNFGVINNILIKLGLKAWTNDWLGNPKTTILSLILTIVWQGAGYYMIIYLAALQSIPTELIEAAKIDGCTTIQRFKNVTFPLLAGAVTINFTLALINAMKIFDQISVMTDGGPGFATETMTYFIYKVAFGELRQGFGTAVAIVLFVTILVFTTIQSKVLRSREVEM